MSSPAGRNSGNLAEKVQVAHQLATLRASQGWLGYLDWLVIDSRPDPGRFRDRALWWQWDRARRYGPALEDVCGLAPGHTGPRSFLDVCPRGYDKTTGLGRLCNYALGFSRRPLEVVVGAADRDQAKLLLDAMKRECELNPWLAPRVTFSKYEAHGLQGSHLEVITADAPTAFGKRIDIFALDELTHWEKPDLWTALWTGRAKMPGSLVFIIENAGVLESWQWDLIQRAKADRDWVVTEAPPGRVWPTWMSEEQVARERKLVPPSEARRLFDNEWIDPAEEAGYLVREDIQRCVDLGSVMGLTYNRTGQPGVEYWASIDYGPRRDRTTLAILHQEYSGLLVVDQLDVWQGRPQEPIQISRIYEWIEERRKMFGDLHIVVDKYEMEEMVQHYERHLHIERWEARGGKANYEMAECLRSLIVNRQITWYPGAGTLPLQDAQVEDFAAELRALVIKRMPYGYRIDHEATKHDDRTVAVGMAAVKLLERVRPAPWSRPPQVEQKPVEITPLRIRTSAESRGLFGMSQRRGDR